MKKLGISAILAASIVSSAFAGSVSLATDYLGDFLIAPFYQAKGNVCTRVTVQNTNTTHSILAKVAFREQIASNEVDLPIFLSPGDVWDGRVCQGPNGDVYLTSNDDSNHPKILGTLKVGKDLTQQSKTAGHTNIDFTSGYIEVYPIAEFNEHSTAKVDKKILVKRWDSLIEGQIPVNTLRSGVDGYSLTGKVSFETKNTRVVTASEKMVAFKGAHSRVLTGSVIAYGNDTSPSVLLGNSKEIQILKKLQHSKALFTYDNSGKNQYIVFTYPFGYVDGQVRKFRVTIRDMEENKEETKVIFSPAPVINYEMKNEVAIISVEKLIAGTNNPAKYQKGQIQITDITNENDIQLGKGKHASFIATLIRTDTDLNKNTIINDAIPVATK